MPTPPAFLTFTSPAAVPHLLHRLPATLSAPRAALPVHRTTYISCGPLSLPLLPRACRYYLPATVLLFYFHHLLPPCTYTYHQFFAAHTTRAHLAYILTPACFFVLAFGANFACALSLPARIAIGWRAVLLCVCLCYL